MKLQTMALHHAPLLHQLYLDTPDYFALLSTNPPSLGEVERDVQTALFDPRRRLELLYRHSGTPDGQTAQSNELLGSLDYKLDFPEPGDVTINLLLIRGDLQSGGLGRQAVHLLEKQLPAGTVRLLASVLGENPRAVAFWERLGFSFATDARPVMTWYAKPIGNARISLKTPVLTPLL
ncbi:GNAT family N-acetyltransferase [Deinococcus sp. KNUC1210]|uniref:GNAT family N-acetyltransferase n=1 Tax=Deinococcus sp. KNUC1210 TaxID=2917691 RepID=UPI001EF11742|nr:GNAT family N-acetyltransferase [Deinococcus sp. KNUC1210]ULH14519.1 GNAT family N-acetyltransferase [Deinococcus sp. KNUC1210]